MEITPAAQLPAPADRIEAAADYLLDRQERGELDGLSNGEITSSPSTRPPGNCSSRRLPARSTPPRLPLSPAESGPAHHRAGPLS
jgi:hypothetical protein